MISVAGASLCLAGVVVGRTGACGTRPLSLLVTRRTPSPPPLKPTYVRAVISRVGMPSSSTYQSPMIILIAGVAA